MTKLYSLLAVLVQFAIFSASGQKLVTEATWNTSEQDVATDNTAQVRLSAGEDFQYDGIWYSIIDPDAKTCKTKEGTSIDGQIRAGNSFEGNLVIPPTVSDGTNEYSVVTIGFHSFDSNTGLLSVSLPMGLTSIEDGAFLDCNNLESVSLPSSLSKIGLSAFRYCWGLTDVALPDNLTEISEGLFYDCYNLANVKMPSSLTQIGFEAFTYSRALQFIELPETLVSIANGAFSGGGLTALILPASVESVGEMSFSGCPIVSLTLPSSLKTIGFSAFSDCYDIKNITYFSDTPITADESVFNGNAYENATLDVPNATLASVQATVPWNQFGRIVAKDGSVGIGLSAGEDFQYDGIWYTVIDPDAKTCKTKDGGYDSDNNRYVPGNTYAGELVIPAEVSFTSDDFSVTETYSVKEIGYAGFAATEITSLVLSEGLSHISGSAFSEAKMLASVTLPESLLIIGDYAFSECTSLSSIVIPENVTAIPYMCFDGCGSLKTVRLPENLNVIGVNAFQSCSQLNSINMPSALRRIEGGAFNMCALTSIVIPDNVVHIGFWTFQGNPLVSVSLPASMESFDEQPFNTCFDISEVTYFAEVPISTVESVFEDAVYSNAILNTPNATLASVQATVPWNKFGHIIAKDGSVGIGFSAGEDFEYNGILYTVIDPDAKTCRTKAGYYDFDNDRHIPGNAYSGDLVIPAKVSFNSVDYSVIEIGYAGFAESDITSIVLPESLTNISSSAFINSKAIVSAVLPETLTTIGSTAFFGCAALKEINLPNSLIELGYSAFEGCSSLESIDVPDSITILNDYVFCECESLTSVRLPQNLTSIGVNAFFCCYGLTSIDLPESLITIKDAAFYCCRNLKQVNLPESLESLEYAAFKECYAMTSVTLPASLKELGEIAFEFCNFTEVNYNAASLISAPDNVFSQSVYNGAILNTPNATLASVQATVPWNKFGHIVAEDGSVGIGLSAGDDFEYDGIWYTVINSEAMTCKTKDASVDFAGNVVAGNLVIPESVTYNGDRYTVTGIGVRSFNSCSGLYSVTLPATIENFGSDAFADCGSLAAVEWKGSTVLPESFISQIGNPNLLIYVDHAGSVPGSVDRNVVEPDGTCSSLVLTPGYPFNPIRAFTALHGSMTKEFTQPTEIGICRGWETLTLPFEPQHIMHESGKEIVPFESWTKLDADTRPFWLYGASADGWQAAPTIKRGVPYIISMPNNREYVADYNLAGNVTFIAENVSLGTEESLPQTYEWIEGMRFRGTFMPLEEEGLLSLNTAGEGGMLPGSVFTSEAATLPFGAYVTGAGTRRSVPVFGDFTGVELPKVSEYGITVDVSVPGAIRITGLDARHVAVNTVTGAVVAVAEIPAGDSIVIDGLPAGIYIVAGMKVMVK